MHIGFLIASDSRTRFNVSLSVLGIGYLSAWVKKNCWWAETSFHRTVEELIDSKPNLVAITSTAGNFTRATSMARQVKEALGVPVLAEGMHLTSLPHVLPKEYDLGVIGEGENTFLEIVRLYHDTAKPTERDFEKLRGIVWHRNGQVVVNPAAELIGDLDTLPYPDRDLIDRGWKGPRGDTIHLISSRGCACKCSFCSSSVQGKPLRSFSPEYVADEIEYLRERYNPEVLFFLDDLFVGQIERWRQVVKLFRERRIHEGISFRAYSSVELMTEQIGEEFDELNFRFIDFGFESNNAEVLNFLTKTNVTPEMNQRAVDICARSGISIGANFIIGSPPETPEALRETYDFANRNREKLDRCSVRPLMPLPGTPVWDTAKGKGLLSDEIDFGYLGATYDNFEFDRFPFMGDSTTREQFWSDWTRFNLLEKEINCAGDLKRVVWQRDHHKREAQRLREELKRMNGSRLIRAVNWLRKLRGESMQPD